MKTTSTASISLARRTFARRDNGLEISVRATVKNASQSGHVKRIAAFLPIAEYSAAARPRATRNAYFKLNERELRAPSHPQPHPTPSFLPHAYMPGIRRYARLEMSGKVRGGGRTEGDDGQEMERWGRGATGKGVWRWGGAKPEQFQRT